MPVSRLQRDFALERFERYETGQMCNNIELLTISIPYRQAIWKASFWTTVMLNLEWNETIDSNGVYTDLV